MIILELNKYVYSLDSIQKTAKVYQGYAEIAVFQSSKYWNVRFDHCRFSEERTVKEFENYLIGIENTYGNH